MTDKQRSMCSIVLNNGKIINVRVSDIEWIEKSRIIRLIYDNHVVARINIDNVAGWIETDYMTESED